MHTTVARPVYIKELMIHIRVKLNGTVFILCYR